MKAPITTMTMLAALLAAGGCQREDEGPLAIEGKLFAFNYRVSTATYVLTLARKSTLPEHSFIETSYEDPRGGPPIMTKTKIFPSWTKVALESPPIHCVVKNRPYHVTMTVTDGKGDVIQTIETTLTSDLDQSILPAKPLIVGAIYTANPEVYKPGQKPDFSPEACPST
ncbi:hypothetical protein ACQQ2Q_01100 [Agrobacterium sp. ES01]|uniref:hypothetical protein n=1 Tax=Agrobacterium sp. ES01 TaxID=3420714 RepID=UPI003D0ADA49